MMSTGEWITAVCGAIFLAAVVYWLFFGGDDE
jgi:hypothetical protein